MDLPSPSLPVPTATGARRRVAVVLFNLGGPDAPESIRPFLVNLFTDPAILSIAAMIDRMAWGCRLTSTQALAGRSVLPGPFPIRRSGLHADPRLEIEGAGQQCFVI